MAYGAHDDCNPSYAEYVAWSKTVVIVSFAQGAEVQLLQSCVFVPRDCMRADKNGESSGLLRTARLKASLKWSLRF